MVRDLVFKYQGQDYALRPTFELVQKLEQSKPLLSMLTAVKDGANLTDVAGYLAVLLEASGHKVDKLEALHALSDPTCSGVDHIIMEVLKAAMPHLFDDKKKPVAGQAPARMSKANKKAG